MHFSHNAKCNENRSNNTIIMNSLAYLSCRGEGLFHRCQEHIGSQLHRDPMEGQLSKQGSCHGLRESECVKLSTTMQNTQLRDLKRKADTVLLNAITFNDFCCCIFICIVNMRSNTLNLVSVLHSSGYVQVLDSHC